MDHFEHAGAGNGIGSERGGVRRLRAHRAVRGRGVARARVVPLLLGRDQDKRQALAQAQPGLEARQASVDDPASLDRALNSAAAVINCAGPSPRPPPR